MIIHRLKLKKIHAGRGRVPREGRGRSIGCVEIEIVSEPVGVDADGGAQKHKQHCGQGMLFGDPIESNPVDGGSVAGNNAIS